MTSKEANLLRQLLAQEQPIPIKQLLLSLEISDKTLRSMIRNMNEEFLDAQGEIVLERGKGYYLAARDRSTVKLMLEESVSAEEASVIEVFCHMVDLREYVTMDYVCEQLYISKSKLNGILGDIKRLIQPFGLSLKSKPHYGMKLDGDELGFRLAIASILKEEQYIQQQEYAFVELIVVEEFRQFDISCSDLILQNLIYHIQIMLERCMNGHVIRLEALSSHDKIPNLQLIDHIWSRLEQKLGDNLPENEKVYLVSCIMGQVASIKQQDLDDVRVKVHMIIDSFLQKIEETYDVSLWEDAHLRTSLQFHLEPLISRLKNDVHYKNPIQQEIKQQFAFAFNLGMLCADEITKIYNKALTEDDIAYLTMHIGLALERDVKMSRKTFDRIAIVCTTGKGTSELLKFKIQHSFPNAHYVRTFSLFNKEDILKFEPDIIFSTVPIQVGSYPVEIISPFFTPEDRKKLVVYQRKKDKERLIDRYFSEDLFYGSLDAGVKQEAIGQLCSRMDKTGIIPPNFEELCLIRENLASTAFGNLIALVHPIELCSVVTKVGVGILNKRIDWSGVPVKIVFVIAQAKSNEARDLLLFIQEIVHDSSLMLRLCESETFQEFKEILIEGIGSEL
ncbi:BglG family transcription antiterminator [Paenibacillus peoriae]|uniref:BglG family transcription antiterminator n=1 Tax=Paenibacillus peoriae TaxID=59893 RepID=UPI00026C614D|nr:BglG family transcription antiterminator [Paenibacillus peoriae]MEC0184813.1 BglG family transcription antiterminator [Paenibacillus peoriae]